MSMKNNKETGGSQLSMCPAGRSICLTALRFRCVFNTSFSFAPQTISSPTYQFSNHLNIQGNTSESFHLLWRSRACLYFKQQRFCCSTRSYPDSKFLVIPGFFQSWGHETPYLLYLKWPFKLCLTFLKELTKSHLLSLFNSLRKNWPFPAAPLGLL